MMAPLAPMKVNSVAASNIKCLPDLSNGPLQPRRLMGAPAAVGCKRSLNTGGRGDPAQDSSSGRRPRRRAIGGKMADPRLPRARQLTIILKLDSVNVRHLYGARQHAIP
jgi:hypothetical protein